MPAVCLRPFNGAAQLQGVTSPTFYLPITSQHRDDSLKSKASIRNGMCVYVHVYACALAHAHTRTHTYILKHTHASFNLFKTTCNIYITFFICLYIASVDLKQCIYIYLFINTPRFWSQWMFDPGLLCPSGAFLPGLPVQPVVLRYTNSLVNTPNTPPLLTCRPRLHPCKRSPQEVM